MSVIRNNFRIQVEYLQIYQTQCCHNAQTLVAAGVVSFSISKVRNVLRKQTQIYKLTDIFRILQTSSL